jgi:tetratricopeptide (TPR) repeat protein
MTRRFLGVILFSFIACFVLAATARADDAGQDDLDKATDAKLNARTLNDLDEVIQLLESAQKKGLSDANKEFARGLLVSSLVQRATTRAELLLRAGSTDGRLKDFRNTTLDDLERVVLIDPKQTKALLLIAELQRMPGGNVKRSDEALDQAIKTGDDPDLKAKALLFRATIATDSDKKIELDKKMADLDEAVKLSPGNADIVRIRGLLKAEAGKLEEAIPDINKAIELEPKNTANFQYKSLILSQLKKYDEALAALEQARQIDPKSTVTFLEKARIYALQSNAQAALRELDEARKLDPTNVSAILLHATIVDDPDKKEADLDDAARVSPKSMLVWRTRGLYHAEQKKYDAAIADFDKAIQLDPKDASIHAAKAAVHVEMKKFDEALADLEKATAIEPDSADLMRLRAEVLTDAQKYDEALAILEKLREKDPQDKTLDLQIAMIYNNQHKNDKAKQIYDSILEKDPDLWQALRGRGDVLLNAGKHAEAIADYDKALKLHPEDSGIENNLAWVLATSPDEKVRDGKRAVVLATHACEATQYKAAYILSTLAAAYAETGDMQTALKWSTKALELCEAEQKESLTKELESYKAGKPFRELMKDGKPVDLGEAKKP